MSRQCLCRAWEAEGRRQSHDKAVNARNAIQALAANTGVVSVLRNIVYVHPGFGCVNVRKARYGYKEVSSCNLGQDRWMGGERCKVESHQCSSAHVEEWLCWMPCLKAVGEFGWVGPAESVQGGVCGHGLEEPLVERLWREFRDVNILQVNQKSTAFNSQLVIPDKKNTDLRQVNPLTTLHTGKSAMQFRYQVPKAAKLRFGWAPYTLGCSSSWSISRDYCTVSTDRSRNAPQAPVNWTTSAFITYHRRPWTMTKTKLYGTEKCNFRQ